MLCAQDYALCYGVNQAIEELAANGKLGAIACLTISDLWPQSAKRLDQLKTVSNPPLIGLQISLTGGFSPLSAGFEPAAGGMLPTFTQLSRASLLQQLDHQVISAEIRAQIRRFLSHRNHIPDFLLADVAVMQFGILAEALELAMGHHNLMHLPLLLPDPGRTHAFSPLPPQKDNLLGWIKQKLHRSNHALSINWPRRNYQIMSGPDELREFGDPHSDKPTWLGACPARHDPRLDRFDEDPDLRQQHLLWINSERGA